MNNRNIPEGPRALLTNYHNRPGDEVLIAITIASYDVADERATACLKDRQEVADTVNELQEGQITTMELSKFGSTSGFKMRLDSIKNAYIRATEKINTEVTQFCLDRNKLVHIDSNMRALYPDNRRSVISDQLHKRCSMYIANLQPEYIQRQLSTAIEVFRKEIALLRDLMEEGADPATKMLNQLNQTIKEFEAKLDKEKQARNEAKEEIARLSTNLEVVKAQYEAEQAKVKQQAVLEAERLVLIQNLQNKSNLAAEQAQVALASESAKLKEAQEQLVATGATNNRLAAELQSLRGQLLKQQQESKSDKDALLSLRTESSKAMQAQLEKSTETMIQHAASVEQQRGEIVTLKGELQTLRAQLQQQQEAKAHGAQASAQPQCKVAGSGGESLLGAAPSQLKLKEAMDTIEQQKQALAALQEQLQQREANRRLHSSELVEPDSEPLSAAPLDKPTQELVTALEKYIKRIAGKEVAEIKDEDVDEDVIDFSKGFWVLSDSRAVNREVNFRLAREMLAALKGHKTVTQADVMKKKAAILTSKNCRLFKNPNYKERGINSSELNAVINKLKIN